MKLVVFSAKTEELREIVIVPDFEWGGEGCLGCDVGSGMVHWIPKRGQVTQQSPKTEKSEFQQRESLFLSTAPLQPALAQSQPSSLLQAQYQQHIPSQSESPSKLPQVPQVNVSVPSARPVVNLSSDQHTSQQSAQVSQAIFPESVPAPALAPPPMTSYHHQPHSQQHHQPHHQQIQHQQSPIDDIPMPNFTVPSDIINQK